MSDFIKVNFKDGRTSIICKQNIKLDDAGGRYFYTSIHSVLDGHLTLLTAIQSNSKVNGFSDYILESSEITREEYDRLCKELGVE